MIRLRIPLTRAGQPVDGVVGVAGVAVGGRHVPQRWISWPTVWIDQVPSSSIEVEQTLT